MIREQVRRAVPGIPVLLFTIVVLFAAIAALVRGAHLDSEVWILSSVGILFLDVLVAAGLFNVNPNEGRVLQLFGAYTGTVRDPGLRWANPFYTKKKVSLRVRNFETGKLKVNDLSGNPIEIAAVVVWRVVDTAEAVFHVDHYEEFVHVQSEAALRNLATGYAYDAYDDEAVSLRSHAAEISEQLKREIQERLAQAGVEVIESRISHLAYAPEIAGAMLQRQQASAVVAARFRIVEGAVGMVESALEMLAARNVIELDGERRAAMVSNLLVVLCGDRTPHPVINAGSLYQ